MEKRTWKNLKDVFIIVFSIIVFVGLLLLFKPGVIFISKLKTINKVDGDFSNQTLSYDDIQTDLAVFDDYLLKYRYDENNVALVSQNSASMTLHGNFERHQVTKPIGFVCINDYILAFYNSGYENTIKVYNTHNEDFLTDFKSAASFSISGGRIVEIKQLENELYVAVLINNGYEGSAVLDTGENKTPLTQKSVPLKKYTESGYLVLRLSLGEDGVTSELAYLSGINPKHIAITENGLYAMFKKSELNHVYVKYSIADFSIAKSKKIGMFSLEKYYQDGDNAVLLYSSKEYQNVYRLDVYNADLKKLDSEKLKDISIRSKYFLPNRYVIQSASYADEDLVCFEYSLFGKKFKLKKYAIENYSSTYRNLKAVTHGSLGRDSNIKCAYGVDSKVRVYDGTTQELLTSFGLERGEHYDNYNASNFYYDDQNGKLYFEYSRTIIGNNKVFRDIYSVELESGEVKKLSCNTDSVDYNRLLGEMKYERFVIKDNRIYLVYDSLIREFDLDFNEIKAVDLRQTVNIWFVNEDGSVASDTVIREVGTKLTSDEIRLIVPNREGFRFVRWQNLDGAKLYDLKHDVTLTAEWEVADDENN